MPVLLLVTAVAEVRGGLPPGPGAGGAMGAEAGAGRDMVPKSSGSPSPNKLAPYGSELMPGGHTLLSPAPLAVRLPAAIARLKSDSSRVGGPAPQCMYVCECGCAAGGGSGGWGQHTVRARNNQHSPHLTTPTTKQRDAIKSTIQHAVPTK